MNKTMPNIPSVPQPATSPTLIPSDRLPVVEFEYPSSEDGKMKVRYLRVFLADADFIKGYELDNPGSKKDGQIKTFSRTKLSRFSPTLLSFNVG